MKYAYLIKTNTSYGEGYETMSNWYTDKQICINSLIKSLNGNKLSENIINNEMFNCYVNVYLITDEINDDDIYFITKYNIIQSEEKIPFCDGFRSKFSNKNFEFW